MRTPVHRSDLLPGVDAARLNQLADEAGDDELVESWFGQPNLRLLPDSPRSVRETLRLLDAVGAAGNLTTDAQIAAHALEQDAVVATNDADFARFPGVRTVNPLRV